MDLTILSGPGELLPCDPECMLVYCYIRLKGAPINLKMESPYRKNPIDYPILSHDSKNYSGIPVILTYLRRENYGLEYELSDVEGVQLCALISAIERRLSPAVNWFLWSDDSVYTKFTRRIYFETIGFMHQFYIPYIWRNERIRIAKSSQLVICLKSMSESQIGEYLYALAKLCITSLSYILGENTYFVGNRPTAVDAYIFAYIWPLLLYESEHGDASWWDMDYNKSSSRHVQSGLHQLITHLLQCPNIIRHFKHIVSKYFPKQVKYFKKEKLVLDKSTVSHPIRDCLLWGTGVAGLFIIYAYYSNNLRIPRRFCG
ncbi:unnamed protein product [Heterobilharzia americana]|nr:unnamed protein product [Heterobilharzia americana]